LEILFVEESLTQNWLNLTILTYWCNETMDRLLSQMAAIWSNSIPHSLSLTVETAAEFRNYTRAIRNTFLLLQSEMILDSVSLFQATLFDTPQIVF
jgi:hypothetical protein